MAYKVFTNGSPLPASDLNTFLMNQSVMTFANSTARTAALPTPTEGMVTWLDDTNRLDVWNGSSWVLVNDNAASVPLSTVTTAGDLIVANGNASVTRLGIGANGTVLTSNGTTATWGAAAAENWSQLNTGNITTGVSSYNVTGFSARNKYLLQITNLSTNSTANVEIQIRFNTTAPNSFYQQAIQLMSPSTYATGSLTDYTSSATSQLILARQSNNAAGLVNGSVYVSNAQSTDSFKYYNWAGTGNAGGGNSHNAFWGSGIWNNTAAITTFQVITGAGTFDAGTWTLWGSN